MKANMCFSPLTVICATAFAYNTAHAVPAPPTISQMQKTSFTLGINIDAATYNDIFKEKDSVTIPIQWNKWWGTPGTSVKYLINGDTVEKAEIHSSGKSAQAGSTNLTITKAGKYNITVELCDANECSSSEPQTITVSSTDVDDAPPLF